MLFAQTCSSSLRELGRGAEPPSGGMIFTAAVLHLSPSGNRRGWEKRWLLLRAPERGGHPQPQTNGSSILRAPRESPSARTAATGLGGAPHPHAGTLEPPTSSHGRARFPVCRPAAPQHRPARQRRVAARPGPYPRAPLCPSSSSCASSWRHPRRRARPRRPCPRARGAARRSGAAPAPPPAPRPPCRRGRAASRARTEPGTPAGPAPRSVVRAGHAGTGEDSAGRAGGGGASAAHARRRRCACARAREGGAGPGQLPSARLDKKWKEEILQKQPFAWEGTGATFPYGMWDC